MVSSDDQELSTAIKNADSPAWSVRAAAGRQLATSDKIDEVADVLHRLLLDAQDTAVTSATAEALLARKDTLGLRYVLLARSYATETWTAHEIQAALDCDPDWMTTKGADRLIKQLGALVTDGDAGVRDEAQRILSRLRPREEWARDSDHDTL
ncbi:hypothetical protein OG897_30460 [Streptomyces sp. NBC_00237]|uniref:hypothetical protein n=1 Tax=Streptomyces sp. NBC_00237 TaxID=2975687 RepID=UPI002253B3CB|nr:hypothetical protein [Streptomyces sp. NBC_00237]MCX5205762.1 hypothetical protein [Streptomyces sp. NBC_00237]